MNSYQHAQSSMRKWGGSIEDYLPIHTFIDSSKQSHGDVRHRALYHHTEGIFLVERIFGAAIEVRKNSKSVMIPTRLIAERHVLEDLGWIPSFSDYLKGMPIEKWMSGSQRKTVPLSVILKEQ